MPRNILEDIKPISRDPRPAAPVPQQQNAALPPKRTTPLPREIPFEPAPERPTSRYALWYIAVACVIGFLFSLSYLFEHANITVTPKSMVVAFDSTQTFTAQKDSTDPTAIDYTVMTLSGNQTISLPSSESKTVSEDATGTVVLYNAYSKTPYKLAINTRLATSDGTIYRIDKATTIPGYTMSGGTLVPGSIEATATAFVAGEAGNIAQSDFTLPGLAALPQGKKIYARTKTAMTGGVSGTVYTVPQDTADAALGTLSDQLKASLMAKARVQVPDGYLFYPGATLFTTDKSVQAPSATTQDVPIVLDGTLTAYLIKQDTLINAIATQSVSQYNGEPVTIPALSSLTLAPVGGAALDPANDTSFPFTFSGSATILWTVDPSDVKTILAGKSKADFDSIIGTLTGIDKAQAVIKPFWKSTFPADPSRITVTIAPPAAE